MKKILSLILTLALMLSAFSTLGIVVQATESGDSTGPAIITDVALIVDDVEYRGTLATIYYDSTVYLKVYGTNLQNATSDNQVMYKSAHSQSMGPGARWEVDPSGTFATREFISDYFANVTEAFTLKYTNDDQATWQVSTTSVVYSATRPCEHYDGGDNYNNICDDCNEYIGTGELAIGENLVMMTDFGINQRDLIKFVPTESGEYFFYSTMSGSDPRALLFDSDLQQLVYDDDGLGYPNFGFVHELEAGETYYLSVVTYSELVECSVTVEKHEHSGGEQTCMGYLCACGEYYGEAGTEHRLSDEQACAGYQCSDCYEFFGEGTGEHTDSDYYTNICDVCDEYIGEASAVMGENTLFITVGNSIYIKFVPSESDSYEIYSHSEFNSAIELYDSKGELLATGHKKDGYNFILVDELTAGETYYLALYEYDEDNELTYFIGKHEHTDGDDEYHGLCDGCYEYCGDESAVLGENKVSVIERESQCVIFVPSETGIYKIYSQSEFDPRIDVYDSDFEEIGSADDQNEYNFILYIELEEGKTYYFEFYEYDAGNELTYFVEKHEHSMRMTCIGVICECGELDDSEVDEDAHVWYFGYCVHHENVAYPEDMECTHDWYFGACSVCGDYYPEDMECTHDWVNGPCKICGIWHGCTEFDDNGVCIVCDYKMYNVVVITNGETAFYYTFEEALEAAVDGSVIKLLDDAWPGNVDVNQAITIDLNGFELFAATLYTIDVYAPITLTDSRGDGYCGLGIKLYAPAVLEGGRYYYISIEFDTEDTVSDYLAPCAYFADYDEIEDTFVSYVEIALEHNEKQICTGVVCDDCGAKLEGEGDPDVHNFVDYEHFSDATCIENAKVCSVCTWCNDATDVREIGNTMVDHTWSGDYGEGTKTCDVCHLNVTDTVYSDEPARDFVRDAYEFLKELILDFLRDNYGLSVTD